MDLQKLEITTGIILCKDGTKRVINGYIRNYSDIGRVIEGANYLATVTTGSSISPNERRERVGRTQAQKEELRAEKKAFKKRLYLTHPQDRKAGLSAEQIWTKNLTVNAKTN